MVVQIDVQKLQSGEYWTNVYHIDSADVGDGDAAASLIVAAERLIHSTGVAFSKVRIATYPVSDGEFIILPLSGTGSRTFSGGQLALFNVARTDISVGRGRPCRKYYRAPIYEGDQEDGALTIAFRGVVDTALNDLIGDLPTLCDPGGTRWVEATTAVAVGMRQLRRGSRRRTEPVI